MAMIFLFYIPCSADVGKKITVTAYNPVKSQCSGDPTTTASGLKLKKKHHDKKIIALSRGLSKQFDYGDKFKLIIENKVYDVEFHDTMNKRFKNRADILMFDKKMAKEFGVKEGILIRID